MLLIPWVADVFWYRENDEVEELEEGDDVELRMDGDEHTVKIYDINKQADGQYMCIAISDQGKAIKYFTLTVKGYFPCFSLKLFH